MLKVKEPKAFAASLAGMRPDLEKASAIAYVVSQGQDQTELVIVHIVGRSGEKLSAFVDAEKAKSGGLFATANEFFVARDDAYQVPSPWPEQKTFDVFLRFKVKDYEAWRSHFDQNGEVRAASGVIGYGIHRSLADERVIVHYLAKSTDLLRQIASMPEITKLMKDQGIQGKPQTLLRHQHRRAESAGEVARGRNSTGAVAADDRRLVANLSGLRAAHCWLVSHVADWSAAREASAPLRRDVRVSAVVQLPVSEWGAATGFDCGEPRSRK